jgi:glycosyltransferase involved in cell wall biosynthesis
MDISIIICTWNRAVVLHQTLERLAALQVPAGVSWELLVVDNRSTDHTKEIVAAYSTRLPVVYLFEPIAGKSNAANRGIEAARGELLLWTDDDVLVEPDWLAEYARAANDWPAAAFFGGPISPWFAHNPPSWVVRNMCHLGAIYALRELGEHTRLFKRGEYPYGANMAIRKNALAQVHFDPKLGPNCFDQVRGEEVDLLARLTKMGEYGVWVSSARVAHYVPAERMTVRYLWHYYVGKGRTETRQQAPDRWRTFLGLPRWAIRQYLEALGRVACLSVFRDKRWLRAMRAAATAHGIISESWRLRRQRSK